MIKLKLNSKILNKDGIETTMDVAPFAKDNRTYVPIRFVAEAFGLNVEWKQETQEVIISNRQKYFATADECAYDWAMHFNPMSCDMEREITGLIHKDENGYYWEVLRAGDYSSAILGIHEMRKAVAGIHSHGACSGDASNADRALTNNSGRPLYLVDKYGILWVINPKEAGQTGRNKQIQVTDGLPKGSKHCTDAEFEKCSQTMREYFKDGYFGLADEIELGYIADYHNRMYMKGVKFND